MDTTVFMPTEDREWWLQSTLSSQLRRAHNYDYKAPGTYMITMNKNLNVPLLSSLCGDPTVIEGVCTSEVKYVRQCVLNFFS